MRNYMFIGLDNLIELKLYKCCFYYTIYDKLNIDYNVFKGLSGLKTLHLSLISQLIFHRESLLIHSDEFFNTPMLTYLKLSGNKCRLHENTFSHLKHLKTIELNDKSVLNHIDSNVLEDLRKLNIEIIIQ